MLILTFDYHHYSNLRNEKLRLSFSVCLLLNIIVEWILIMKYQHYDIYPYYAHLLEHS